MANLNFNADSKTNLASYTTAGQVIFTEDNLYLVKNDGSKIKYSSIEVVSSLPVSQISSDKIYILKPSFSLNLYDGSAWHIAGGINQISIGTTAPTDTTKLFLDITSTTSPMLKYYNGTSWISISGSIDTSALLDKNTYKGSADGIVKKADTLTGLISKPSQIDNIVNNSITVDNTNRSNGKVIGWNNGQNEYLNLTISGIVGSSGNIITASGNPITIASGAEATFIYPSSIDDKIMINIQEQISENSIIDTHLNFSDSSKYSLQDDNKIIFNLNKVELKPASNPIIKNITPLMISSNEPSPYLVSSDNEQSNFGFAFWKCLDGDATTTRWSTNNGVSSAYGIIDFGLGNEKIFWEVDIKPYTGQMKDFQILASNNNINYTLLYSGTHTNDDAYINCSFENYKRYRYLKIYITSSYTNYMGLWDIKIFSNETYLTNTPTYLKTTGVSNFSISIINTIKSLTMPVTIPANTSVKCLFSVDNGINWLYKDEIGIHKFTGDLSLDWTNYNNNIDIQTYFTNLNIAQLATDLSGLGILPVSLDFAFQLNTTDSSVTPSVSAIILNYTTPSHREFASFGGYDETSVKFNVKRISDTALVVKNNTSTTREAIVNVIVGN